MRGDDGMMIRLLRELCAERGLAVTFDPAYGRAGAIRLGDGRLAFFKGTAFDINGHGAAQIARDKDFCAGFLRRAGLNAPEGVVAFAPWLIDAMRGKNPAVAARLDSLRTVDRFRRAYGFPLFVKPNEGSEGEGVARVDGAGALYRHLFGLFRRHERVLVQRPVAGDDHRVVVLDGAVLCAYRRAPPTIRGDGRSTAETLARQAFDRLRAGGRNVTVRPSDAAVRAHLASQGVRPESILEEGRSLALLPGANLITGGTAVDVRDRLDPAYAALCVRAAAAVGLRLAGVDLICRDIAARDDSHAIIEVNAAPSLHAFARHGPDAAAQVRHLYRALIAALDGGAPPGTPASPPLASTTTIGE